MKRMRIPWLLVVTLLCGCSRSEKSTRWEEVQFRIALRPVQYVKGDVAGSGPFEDLLNVSVVVPVPDGKGSAHIVQHGVWLHLRWDGVREEAIPKPTLLFDGLEYRFENRFASPYGAFWQDAGWQKLGTRGILQEWDLIQTPGGIDPSGNDARIWCKLCRWAPRKVLPDLKLGEKKEREQAESTVPVKAAPRASSTAR